MNSNSNLNLEIKKLEEKKYDHFGIPITPNYYSHQAPLHEYLNEKNKSDYFGDKYEENEENIIIGGVNTIKNYSFKQVVGIK